MAGVYGVLYEDADGSGRAENCTTGGTFQGWKFATAGPLSGGVTADVADANADHLTVPEAGDYAVLVRSQGFLVDASTETGHMRVAVNDTPVARTDSRMRNGSVSVIGNFIIMDILTLSADDTVSLYWTVATTNNDINFRNTSLVVIKQ